MSLSGPQDGSRIDPLEDHYHSVERSEELIEAVDWVSLLCFLLYASLHTFHAPGEVIAKWCFVILACCAIAFRIDSDLRARYQADCKRRRLLVSDSFGVPVIALQQKGYYTSDLSHSWRRLADSLAENTFFHPRLLQAELRRAYAFSAIALVILLLSIRFAPVEYVELFGLLIFFGESGVVRVLRIRWAVGRFNLLHEEVCSALRRIGSGDVSADLFQASIILCLADYEVIKAKLRIRPRRRFFEQMNPTLTKEWDAGNSGAGRA